MINQKKKKKKQLDDPLDEIVVETYFESESERSPIRQEELGFGFESLQRDSSVKSTFQKTGSLGGNVSVSNTNTTTNLGDPTSNAIPEKAMSDHPRFQ